jgi:anti-sigma factor (TIGR02949 family)
MGDKPVNCEQVLRHLLAYLDGELDAADAADIQRHLEACRGCFSRARFERELKRHVSESATRAAPATLQARLRDLLDSF